MAECVAEVRRLEKFFDGFEVWYVLHLDNQDADHLAWITSSKASTPPDVIIEKLTKPPVKAGEPAEQADFMVIDGPDQEPTYDWMTPISMFLENQPPSDDNVEVERIARNAKMYHLIDGVLYRRGAMAWWCGASPERKAFSWCRIFIVVFADHTHHDALS
jgi:hypothetical protein